MVSQKMNTEKHYPIWIASRRARKWAGPITFFALEFISIMIGVITIALRSNMQPGYDDTPLRQLYAWCLGTPIVIIAIAHLLLGIDAAYKTKMEDLERRKWEMK